MLDSIKKIRREFQYYFLFGRRIHKLHRENRKIYICAESAVHGNMGDQALGFCRREILLNLGIPEDEIIEYTSRDRMRYWPQICKIHIKSDIILLRGGGFWGDLWLDGFEALLQYIETFKDNPIVVFPQSVFFSDTEDGKRWLKYSQQIIQNTLNLTIFARDKVSFNYLKKYYPFANIKLAPDTVLAYKPKNFAIQKKRGIILCFRNDKEKGKLDFRKNVLELLTKKNIKFSFQDTNIDFNLKNLKERKQKLFELWEKFLKAKLVITDRAHGMIFSAITGTPCIAFNNIDGKVKHEYEWLKDLDYVKYLDTTDDFEIIVDKLLQESETQYPIERINPYFDDLRDVLRNI